MASRYKLSKSKITEYLQCGKRLYLSVHHPELAKISSGMQSSFQIGHQVGELARQLFPDGMMVGDESNNLREALIQTEQLIRDYPEKPLFEATFQHGDMLIRTDILVPSQKGYRMIEVKSSTSVKDYYLPDCAMQSWVLENNGIKLDHVSLMNIDNSFIYRATGNYQGLLKETDISVEIEPFKQEIPRWIAECQDLLAGAAPEIEPRNQCNSPFPCPFNEYCHAHLPEYPIDVLPRNKARGTIESLKAAGFQDLRKVPAGMIAHDLLEKVRRVTASGEAELDQEAGKRLSLLPYPRYYLDFETIQFTIPRWLDTQPFQQLPFQWSCHVETSDWKLEHREFLDTRGDAPMRDFAESLIKNLGTEGPILVYNQGFEKGRMQELANRYPDLAPQLEMLIDRVVDLLPLARDYYYHPAMKGSWSIKAVLPTIAADLDYKQLDEVQDGGGAQMAYLEMIDSGCTPERKAKLERSLLEYCKLDTYAMVRLARFFVDGKSCRSA